MNRLINYIEEKHGRVQKSNFTLSYWIMLGRRFEDIHTNIYPDQFILERIYTQKYMCIDAMLESGMNEIKVCKQGEEDTWLITLSQKLEGLEYNVVAPYMLFKDRFDINELEETDINRDCIFINNKEYRPRINSKTDKRLVFVLENMEKSRLKMLEKLGEI